MAARRNRGTQARALRARSRHLYETSGTAVEQRKQLGPHCVWPRSASCGAVSPERSGESVRHSGGKLEQQRGALGTRSRICLLTRSFFLYPLIGMPSSPSSPSIMPGTTSMRDVSAPERDSRSLILSCRFFLFAR
jgi:hypothetical protein